MPWPLSKHLNNFRDRNFHLSAVNMEQMVKHDPVTSEDMNKVRTRPFDKILFVWSGKYKSKEEVPDMVARSAITKCHNLCRVKACNYMIALTVIGAIFYVISGKKDAEKGLTVGEMNRQWHKEYNKKFDEAQKNP